MNKTNDEVFGFYESPIGILELKADANHLRAIHFCDDEEDVKRKKEDLSITLSHHPVLHLAHEALDHYFSGDFQIGYLPLQQDGTAFQQEVWEQLQKIPAGKTISYIQLSIMLGNKKAVRAVGTANGKNNIPIFIPCHRVIGACGSLVGYSGKLWRKQWLLNHEAKFMHGLQSLF